MIYLEQCCNFCRFLLVYYRIVTIYLTAFTNSEFLIKPTGMLPKKYLLLFIFLFSGFTVFAQDPQFTQFYANPLYQSPAFAGSALQSRVVFNYRYQWPNLNSNYQTYSASYDHFFEKIKSGVGIQVLNDKQGIGGLNSLDVAGQYAYQLRLSNKFSYRQGLQLSYVQRNINYSALTFGAQWDGNSFNKAISNDENLSTDVKRYADVSTGGLLFSDQFYFGVALHHLTMPKQNFLGQGDVSRLPIKITVQTGWKIPLDMETKRGLAENITDAEKSITPVLLYRQQGLFNQLDAGVYLTYEPIIVGLWYRGLPVRVTNITGINNHDALAVLIGYHLNGLTVGYSYDYTVSKLNNTATGGSHEISVSYTWRNNKKPPVPKSMKYTPCPRF